MHITPSCGHNLQLTPAIYLIVVLDVDSVDGLPEAIGLVQVSQVAPDIGIVHESLLVAL